MRLNGDHLDLRVDRRRQLAVLDPTGRQLTISCGAALFNARLSLAASGFEAQIDRFPDPRDGDLVARVTTVADQRPQVHSRVSLASMAALHTLDGYVENRRTNRQPFADSEVSTDVLAVLAQAVEAEQGELAVVASPEHRAALASITTSAQAELDADPAYIAEARGWDQNETRTLADGHCVVVVGSGTDHPSDWLRVGEALERLLLEATRQGYVVGPISQTIVTTTQRADLRRELELPTTPQVVLRIGHAPESLASRRRRLGDVLVEDL